MPEGTNGQGHPPEDEIDRQLRALTSNLMGEARYKEPTAAERAERAARYRKQVKREQRGQRWRARRPRLTVWAIVVVILAVAGGIIGLRFSHSPAGSATGASATSASAAGSQPGEGPPPADPFVGSEAGTWADGAAGITVPTAKAVGTFTAAQVAAAYAATRKLLIAANLDQPTLAGGAPTAFADLLTKQQRTTFLAGLNTKGTNKSGYPLSTRKWVASFAPGSAQFIGNVIKAHGTMSAQTEHEAGATVLAINVNYLFAYAVEPPGNPDDWMRVIDHQYGSFAFAHWDEPNGQLEAFDQTIIGNAGIQCGTTDGYIHPDYPSQWTSGATESGPAVNPFSSATSQASGGAVCGRTSGT